MAKARLEVTRTPILAFRRRAGALDRRLPPGAPSLRRAAWAGLQDSMPRAALLSIHARVVKTRPTAWEDPSLVQLWGPHFSVFVCARQDLGVFSLGLLPDDAKGRARARDIAGRLEGVLLGERMASDAAGRALGVDANRLRYAGATGTVLIRWDGAHRPLVWTAPAPTEDPAEARSELVRRYLHIYGPATPGAFGKWSGIGPRGALKAFVALRPDLMPVITPIGEAWILTEDEASIRRGDAPFSPARLLPSGDPYTLLHGADRDLLVPDSRRRDLLWTPRVWPGSLLLGGEIVGTWRRQGRALTAEPWRKLSGPEEEALEAEAASLPIPDLSGRLVVHWAA